MFRPLDVHFYDIDWPMLDGRVRGLHDVRVVVYRNVDGIQYPCDVVVVSTTNTSITFALANRFTGSVYNSTYLTVSNLSGTGISEDNDNGIMKVTAVTDGMVISKPDGVLRVMPTCVMWIAPTDTPMNVDAIPVPREGWSRVDDYVKRTITYAADPVYPSEPSKDKLVLVNGASTPDLTITSDGAATIDVSSGTIDVSSGTITINPIHTENPQ